MLSIKTILIGAAALAVAMTSAALADKLDPKWSAPRQKANSLGDAAKAGQEGAYQVLVNKAALGDAPALHNIGWLYQSGFPGVAADREKSCGWFGKAAKRAYPPSMHEKALCLLTAAKTAQDQAARDRLVKMAYAALFEASKAGWTKSALFMSEKILNMAKPSGQDFSIAGMVITYGLDSNPAHEQKVTLSYFEGMRVIYGAGGGRHYFTKGRDALRFADENGHPHAGKALPMLHTRWVRAHITSMDRWSPPEQTGLQCYRAKQKDAANKLANAVKCGALDRSKEKSLARLIEVSETLQSESGGEEKSDLKLARARLNDRSAQFRADAKELAAIFVETLSE